jgi:hypothetical protein
MNCARTYVLAGLFLVGLSGCAVTDFDHSADFAKYKTFEWGRSQIDVSNPLYDSDLIDQKIRNTVEEEFAKRGIVSANDQADLTVRFHTFTEERERRSSAMLHPGYRYFPYAYHPFAFGWIYHPYWMMPPRTEQYTEGTLILDVIDNKTDDLVWRGSVSGDVEDVSRLRKQIDKAVKAIIKKYPGAPAAPLNLDPDDDIVS